MRRQVIIVMLLSVLISACSNRVLDDLDHPVETRKMEIVMAIRLDDLTGNNPMMNSGVWKERIYFLSDERDKMRLNFVTFDEPEKRLGFIIPKGKGPGEVNNPMCISVSDSRIIVFDGTLLKFLIFSSEGEYLEEGVMDPEKGIPFFHDQTPGGFVYSGMLRTRLGIGEIDSQYNIVVKSHVEYDNVVKNLEEMEETGVRTAIPFYSNGEILLSETGDSYTLNSFDMSLKKVRQYFSIPGKHIAIGLGADAENIYIPAPFNFDRARKTGRMESQFRISVMDRKSGKHLSNWVSKLKSVEGIISVLGTYNKKVAMLVLDENNSFGRFMGEKEETSANWLVIVK